MRPYLLQRLPLARPRRLQVQWRGLHGEGNLVGCAAAAPWKPCLGSFASFSALATGNSADQVVARNVLQHAKKEHTALPPGPISHRRRRSPQVPSTITPSGAVCPKLVVACGHGPLVVGPSPFASSCRGQCRGGVILEYRWPRRQFVPDGVGMGGRWLGVLFPRSQDG